MAYSYNKLWKLMIDKKINKTTLRREAGITSNAMAKMGKDLPVSVEVVAKICRVLDCTLDDIVDVLPDEENESKAEEQ
jgi:Predicted transcriptional regulator